MTILLTGCTGFLGSYLLKEFTKNDFKVIGIKRSSSNIYRINKYMKKCKFYDIDKVTISEIFIKNDIDIVINTVTNYGRNCEKTSSIVDTNLMFSLKLIEESINNKIKCFINTDTLLERDLNAYALSKAQVIDWMKLLSNLDIKMVNIKIEHMYGPFDDENKFVYWLINQLKSNVKEINLTSGMQKRDFIYIDDIVNAYMIIIKNTNKFNSFEEFEVGSGKPVEVKEFINLIYEEIDKKQKISTKLNFGVIPYRENENMNMEVNISKLVSLEWKNNTTLKSGINAILKEEN